MLRALLALTLAGAATVEQLSAPGIDVFLPATYDLVWTAVLLLALAGIAAVVARGVVVARRRSAAPVVGQAVEARLEHLDRLHASGRIYDAERAEARARLLGTL